MLDLAMLPKRLALNLTEFGERASKWFVWKWNEVKENDRKM